MAEDSVFIAPEGLTLDDISEAKEIIEETHPMMKTKMSDVLPFLKICGRCCKGSPKDSKKEPLLKQRTKGGSLKKRMRKNKKKKNKSKSGRTDPYMIMGFGINAFFDMMVLLIYVFIGLTVLAIPAIAIFASSNGLENYRNYVTAKFSMGNMGYSASNCYSISMGTGELLLNCNGGELSSLASVAASDDGLTPAKRGYGIIPSD